MLYKEAHYEYYSLKATLKARLISNLYKENTFLNVFRMFTIWQDLKIIYKI